MDVGFISLQPFVYEIDPVSEAGTHRQRNAYELTYIGNDALDLEYLGGFAPLNWTSCEVQGITTILD